MSSSNGFIEVIDVRKEYQASGRTVAALRGVNLVIRKGEYLSLVGPSGSGKTTLLNIIGGLDRPTSGKVIVDGVDITKLNSEQLAEFRRRRGGFIFQTFNLIPGLTVMDNVVLPMIFAGVPREERVKRALSMLEAVGLRDKAHRRPHELSVGEQQRVAIARALASSPLIILADEPTSALDSETGLEVVRLLRSLSKENGVTVVCATHDLEVVGVSDRVVEIRDGVVRPYGEA